MLRATFEEGVSPDAVAERVRELRRRNPASAVALWVQGRPEALIRAVQGAALAHVRAVLGGDCPSTATLRAQLTEPLGLGAFVLCWAADTGYLRPDDPFEDLRMLLDAAPRVCTLDGLARDHRAAPRTWRLRLQRQGLPAPAEWLALGQALQTAFIVQRDPRHPLHVLAHRAGVHSVANLSHRFRRVFRLSPSAIRELLGAEPLLHAWFERNLCAGARARLARA